jgi:hypothetical protein
MNKLMNKGYTADNLKGMDMSQISRSEIRSLPDMDEDNPNYGRLIPDMLRVIKGGANRNRFNSRDLAPDAFNPYTTTFE